MHFVWNLIWNLIVHCDVTGRRCLVLPCNSYVVVINHSTVCVWWGGVGYVHGLAWIGSNNCYLFYLNCLLMGTQSQTSQVDWTDCISDCFCVQMYCTVDSDFHLTLIVAQLNYCCFLLHVAVIHALVQNSEKTSVIRVTVFSPLWGTMMCVRHAHCHSSWIELDWVSKEYRLGLIGAPYAQLKV